MIHSSGFTYEGLWVNGKPAKMATKMELVGVDSTVGITVTQGQSFDIEVQMTDDDGEIVQGLFVIPIKALSQYYINLPSLIIIDMDY